MNSSTSASDTLMASAGTLTAFQSGVLNSGITSTS